MGDSTRIKRASYIQIGLGILLIIFVVFAYVTNLWDQSYLEQIQLDWSTSPILEVIAIPVDTTSDDYDGTAPSCPTDY